MAQWRLLPWLYKWLALFYEETGVDTGVYAPVVFPEDSDERIPVVVSMSLNEFTAVLSALEKGAILSYPDSDQAVVWAFLRNYEYPVAICDLIIDCITNNPATRQAIIDAVLESPEVEDRIIEVAGRLTGPQIEGELIAGSCDDSVLAGKMIALVNSLDTNNRDALEIIENATNDEEKVAALIAAIPAFETLPFDDIIDASQDLLEDFAENYDAISTTERKNDLARDLWCLAKEKEDCALSYGDLYAFFNARVGSVLTLDSGVLALWEWLTTGDFSSDQLVFDGMMFLQIASIRVGGVFFGINMPKIGALTRDALPSSAWEDWDPCGEPLCRHLDAANDLDTIFTATGGLGPQATWDGSKWIANTALINSRITLEADMLASYNIASIRVVFDGTNAIGDSNSVTAYYDHFAGVIDSDTLEEDVTLVTPVTLQKFDLDVVSSFDTSVPLTVGITDIYITFSSGPLPSWGEPC